MQIRSIPTSIATRTGRCGPAVRRTGIALAAGIAMAAAMPAWGQAHTASEGPYVLRASTVSSETLPEQTANAHGIQRDPRRGVLNVMVSEKTGEISRNVAAEVHAVARNLSGHKREVPLREIESNGQVTYLGTYDFVRGEVIDFIIDAVPRGSERKLSLTFRDRLWLQK